MRALLATLVCLVVLVGAALLVSRTVDTTAADMRAGAARALIEGALGQPVARLFRRFDVQPLAAASIAQVHAAELPDGVEPGYDGLEMHA